MGYGALPLIGYNPFDVDNNDFGELDNWTDDVFGGLDTDPTAPPEFTQLQTPEYPAFPERPDLQPWTGRTNVPINPQYRDLQNLGYNAVFNPSAVPQTGRFTSVITGDPNMELFNQAVVVPGQQQLLNETLPLTGAIYSGGAYGSQFQSGARRNAQAEALTNYSNNLASQRLAYDQQATTNQMTALGQTLPNMANTYVNEYNMRSQNLDRAINVHYQNEGLKQQEFQNEVAATNYAMGIVGMNLGIDQYNTDLENQTKMLEWQQKENERQQDEYRNIAILRTLTGADVVGEAGGLIGLYYGGAAGGQAGTQLGNAAGGSSYWQNYSSSSGNSGMYYTNPSNDISVTPYAQNQLSGGYVPPQNNNTQMQPVTLQPMGGGSNVNAGTLGQNVGGTSNVPTTSYTPIDQQYNNVYNPLTGTWSSSQPNSWDFNSLVYGSY